MSGYVVVHATKALKMAVDGCVVPAGEVADFKDALSCVNTLTTLAASEQKRIDEAVEEAKVRGYEAGRAQAQAECEERFAAAVSDCAAQFAEHQAAARRTIATLALAVVRKIAPDIGVESLVPALVHHAVVSLAGEQGKHVRVHPSAAAAAKTRLTEIGSKLDVIADESLDVFGCVIETAHGQLVAGLEDQLATIERVLVDPSQVREAA